LRTLGATSGLGSNSETSSRISRWDIPQARFSTASEFSRVRCGARRAIPLRQPAVSEHLEQDRVLPGRPGHGDAQIGLVLTETKDSPAVLEHRRARLLGIEPPELHLPDVGDDLGLDPPGLLRELDELTQKVLVSHALQALHGDSLGEITPDDVPRVYVHVLPGEVRLADGFGPRRLSRVSTPTPNRTG
jgi:hypothetical protein